MKLAVIITVLYAAQFAAASAQQSAEVSPPTVALPALSESAESDKPSGDSLAPTVMPTGDPNAGAEPHVEDLKHADASSTEASSSVASGMQAAIPNEPRWLNDLPTNALLGAVLVALAIASLMYRQALIPS